MCWRTVEVNGTRIAVKVGESTLLVRECLGNREDVKKELEEKFGKNVVFLGELLALTG